MFAIGLAEQMRRIKLERDAAMDRQIELTSIVYVDPLTGVCNRRHFEKIMTRCLARDAVLPPFPLSLIMVDVDHFKRINDAYGHDAGDAVLKAVVGALKVRLRADAHISRYGGEEFAIILPHTDRGQACLVAERLHTWLHDIQFEAAPGLRVTASFGVSCTTEPESFGRLLRQADQAMYRAKASGRDRVCLSDPPLAAKA